MTSDSSSGDVPPMRMVALPRQHMAARLDDFEARLLKVEMQTDRGRRQRKMMWIAFAGLCVGLLIAYGLVIYLLVGRADSRRYYNDQIRMLICSVPPSDAAKQAIREQAGCPPFRTASPSTSKPRAAAPITPSTPMPTPTSTVTGEARLAPPTPTPGSPARQTRSSAAPQPRTSTRTVQIPRTAAATPAPRATTRTGATPRPTSTPTTGLLPGLPGLLCALLGCH